MKIRIELDLDTQCDIVANTLREDLEMTIDGSHEFEPKQAKRVEKAIRVLLVDLYSAPRRNQKKYAYD